MRVTRRTLLGMGGGLVAALSLPPFDARAAGVVEIRMAGTRDGSRVWFDPIGVLIQPGQTVRWINQDAGNSHTSTAYDPANFDHPRRIPSAAKAWHSDYLLPKESFEVTLIEEGVYDYFCLPHEHAGMVGRIIVGTPEPRGWIEDKAAAADLPEVALKAFPRVQEIMSKRIVRRA